MSSASCTSAWTSTATFDTSEYNKDQGTRRDPGLISTRDATGVSGGGPHTQASGLRARPQPA